MRGGSGILLILAGLVLLYLGATGRLICLRQFGQCLTSPVTGGSNAAN